jgi:hypothetical protein
MPTMLRRKRHLAQAIRWCALSVAWASLVGITALVAGAVAGSLALVGFGADSIVDGLASAVLSVDSAVSDHAPAIPIAWNTGRLRSSVLSSSRSVSISSSARSAPWPATPIPTDP